MLRRVVKTKKKILKEQFTCGGGGIYYNFFLNIYFLQHKD